ncbi:MAG: zinc ribbon domain-containing protein [bacterium]|nr:zinc ribbon domain-containing protein [bacterium]
MTASPQVCPQCQTPLLPNAKFCVKCGATVRHSTAAAPKTTAPSETTASDPAASSTDKSYCQKKTSKPSESQTEPETDKLSAQPDNAATWKELERGQQQISCGLDQSLRDFDKAQRESNRAKKEAKRIAWKTSVKQQSTISSYYQMFSESQTSQPQPDSEHAAPSNADVKTRAASTPAIKASTSAAAKKTVNITTLSVCAVGIFALIVTALFLPTLSLSLFGQNLTIRIDNADTGMVRAAVKSNDTWKNICNSDLIKGTCTLKVPKDKSLQLVIEAPQRQQFISDVFSVTGPTEKKYHLKYLDQYLTINVSCPKLHDPTLTATVYDDNQTIEPFKVTSDKASFAFLVPCEIPLNIKIEADKCAPSVAKYTLDPTDGKTKEIAVKLVRNKGTILISAKGDSVSKAQYKVLERGKEIPFANKFDLSKGAVSINDTALNTPYDVIIYGRGIARSKKSVKLTADKPDAALEFTANFDAKELAREAAEDANATLRGMRGDPQYSYAANRLSRESSLRLIHNKGARGYAYMNAKGLGLNPYDDDVITRLIMAKMCLDVKEHNLGYDSGSKGWSFVSYQNGVMTIRHNATGVTMKGEYNESEKHWEFDVYHLAKELNSIIFTMEKLIDIYSH